MKELKKELRQVRQPQSLIGLTKQQDVSQNNKNNSENKCSCSQEGDNGLPIPCDLVPLDKRIGELKSEFYKQNVCSCEGLEYISFHFPVQHPDFGKYARCLCALESQSTSKKEILMKASNLHDRKMFEDYDLKLNPNCKAGYDAVKDWVNDESTSILMLYGQTGVGKTHLAVASGWAKIGLGKPVLFYTATELIRELQSAVSKGNLDQLINNVKSAQNLILDDLGREYTSGWTTAIFHEIIDYRYNKHVSLNTLITTNHSLSELEKILGLPVVSRLTDHLASSVVIMDGEDVRLKKR
jgi:DNA replication protein DnaC